MGLSSILFLHGGCLLHVLRNEASGGGEEDAGCKQKLQAIQEAPSEAHVGKCTFASHAVQLAVDAWRSPVGMPR